MRDAARPPPQRAVPLPQPPLEQQSPEEKAQYEQASLVALKMTRELQEADPKSGAPADTQQHYMSLLSEFKKGRFDSEMDLYPRDEGRGDVGAPPFRTGRTVAEQADLAKQYSVLQGRMTKAVSQRASEVVRESQEAAKKNKEKVRGGGASSGTLSSSGSPMGSPPSLCRSKWRSRAWRS